MLLLTDAKTLRINQSSPITICCENNATIVFKHIELMLLAHFDA